MSFSEVHVIYVNTWCPSISPNFNSPNVIWAFNMGHCLVTESYSEATARTGTVSNCMLGIGLMVRFKLTQWLQSWNLAKWKGTDSMIYTYMRFPAYVLKVVIIFQVARPSGLQNMGNTCFVNAVIQLLRCATVVTGYIEQHLTAHKNRGILYAVFCLWLVLWLQSVITITRIPSAACILMPIVLHISECVSCNVGHALRGLPGPLHRLIVERQGQLVVDRFRYLCTVTCALHVVFMQIFSWLLWKLTL